MGDDLFTEEELLAHAIALSLENRSADNAGTTQTQGASATASGPPRTPPETSSPHPDPILRSDTNQSCDSLLTEADESLSGSLRWQKQTSQGIISSLRSSPDLGISADNEPQNVTLGVKRKDSDHQKSSRESLMSSPEEDQNAPHVIQNITLDGSEESVTAGGGRRRNLVGEESHQLPYTRLSSLHDMNLGLGEQDKASSKGWSPNQEALELIVGMGISENAAKRALYNTGNDSAELAVGWVFENIGNPELHEPFKPPMPAAAEGVSVGLGAVYHSFDELTAEMMESDQKEAFKMVFVANTDLRMGVGKVAAQVGHAVLGLYQFLEAQFDQKPGIREWESRGAKKIVLKGNSTQHLLDLKQKALELQIPNILIHDAGKTQLDPGSLTVLALFGKSWEVDLVTGKLKLL